MTRRVTTHRNNGKSACDRDMHCTALTSKLIADYTCAHLLTFDLAVFGLAVHDPTSPGHQCTKACMDNTTVASILTGVGNGRHVTARVGG